MNERRRIFHQAVDVICSVTKRHPDYHICLRCEELEMRKGFSVDVWWHLLDRFSVDVRKKFWTGYHRGEDGRPPASFPILGAVGTDDGGGTHAHLLLWRDINKRQMDSNDEMRKRCKQAFAHAVRKQVDHAEQFDTGKGFHGLNINDARSKAVHACEQILKSKKAFNLTRVKVGLFDSLETYIAKHITSDDTHSLDFYNLYAHEIFKREGGITAFRD
jgi:hypothetical protein